MLFHLCLWNLVPSHDLLTSPLRTIEWAQRFLCPFIRGIIVSHIHGNSGSNGICLEAVHILSETSPSSLDCVKYLKQLWGSCYRVLFREHAVIFLSISAGGWGTCGS